MVLLPLPVIVRRYSLEARALHNNHVTVWTPVTASTCSAQSLGQACQLASSVLLYSLVLTHGCMHIQKQTHGCTQDAIIKVH